MTSRLIVDGCIYLSKNNSNSGNTRDNGEFHWCYYGSSSRIIGGVVWHPSKGYRKLRVSVSYNWGMVFGEFFNDVLFDAEIDFKKHIIDALVDENIKQADDLHGFSEMNSSEKTSLVHDRDLIRQQIMSGELASDVTSIMKISLRIDSYYVEIHLRDLHRFEGEVQISGLTYRKIKEWENL